MIRRAFALAVVAFWLVLGGSAGALGYDRPAFAYDGSSSGVSSEAAAVAGESARFGLAMAPRPSAVDNPEGCSYATNTAELPGLSATQAQLEAKFKHAADFGVAEARGAEGFSAFGKAVDAFVTDSGTVRVTGTYRGNPAILNYNPTTAQVVVQATDGTFISGWQMSPAQLQNVITRASLGGG